MASPAEEHKVAVKLLVHKMQNKVIFAEADNHFADILFSFLTLPLGTIIRLVAGGDESDNDPGLKIGSLTTLYRSVADLDLKFFCGEICKIMILNPRNYAEPECQRLKVNIDDTNKSEFYICNYCSYISTRKNNCGRCSRVTSTRVQYASTDKKGVFFYDATTLMIGDDFSIMPSSPRFILELFNRFGVTDVSMLTEKVVHVGKKEILNLLRCSLISSTPLTDTFINAGRQRQYEPSTVLPTQVKLTKNNSKQQFALKLLVRKSDKKILFAEAEEDFINHIFTILTIPLGLVVRLLGGNSRLGSVDQLYASIMNQDVKKYLVPRDCPEINSLMHPKVVPHFTSNEHLIPLPTGNLEDVCVLVNGTIRCCNESNPKFHNSPCVKSPAAFIVTDDLAVRPVSSLFSLAFLNGLNVPAKDVEEKVVSFGINEAYNLLKASLHTESALSETLTGLLNTPKQEK